MRPTITPTITPSKTMPVLPSFSHPAIRKRTYRAMLPFVLGVLSLMTAQPSLAQEEPMLRTLTVTGRGTESVPTTLTQVQLGVEIQGETAAEVQRAVAERSASVVEFLRSRNVSQLQTTGISLNPQYDYSDGRQRLVGYTATNTVSFRIATEQAGATLDQAVAAGATRIDGVSFVADDAALATARQQAIREAVEDAQLQADAALAALGLTRREVVNVQINGAVPPPMPLLRAAPMAEMAAAPTPVIGGEQEVQASVTLQISY
jgi:uncharacterized protein YggE